MKTAIQAVLPIFLGLAVIASAQAKGVMERANARGAFVAAAVPDQLPLAKRDDAGNLTGFDIDVAREIGERLGLPVRFVTPGWNAILGGDWKGDWDYSVANITPTDDRRKHLDFPTSYRLEAAVLVVHDTNTTIEEPADASGKAIGAAQATTFESYLRRSLAIFENDDSLKYLIDNPVIRTFPNKDEALAALARNDGSIHAVVTSFATATAAQEKGMPLKVLPGFLFWQPVSVAIAKGDAAFAQQIEGAVTDMREDGTLRELSENWFGMDMTDLLDR